MKNYHFSLYLIYEGGESIKFYAFWNDKLLFNDVFKPSPLHPVNSLQACIDLLSFLTCQPGDTHDEYFSKYNRLQMEWVKTFDCEQLKGMVSDFEMDKSEGHKNAKNYFQMRFAL